MHDRADHLGAGLAGIEVRVNREQLCAARQLHVLAEIVENVLRDARYGGFGFGAHRSPLKMTSSPA